MNKLTIIPIIAIIMLVLTIGFATAVTNDAIESYSYDNTALPLATDGSEGEYLNNSGATRTAGTGDNYYYDFDGTNDYQELSMNVDDNAQTTIIVSAYNTGSPTGDDRIIDLYESGNNKFHILVDTTGKLRVDYETSNTWRMSDPSLPTFPLNQWNCIAVLVESGNQKVYLNNNLEFSGAHSSDLTDIDGNVNTVGSHQRIADFWTGRIDQPIFYDRILTTGEIASVCSGGTPVNPYVTTEILTTNITSIYLNPNGTVYSDEAGLNGVVTINQTSGIYLNYTYYVNNVSTETGQDTTPATLTLANMNPSNFEHRDEIIVQAIAVNSSNQSQRLSLPRNSTTLTIANYAPTVTATLTPLTALNTSLINGYCLIDDEDEDTMNITWKIYNDTGTYSGGTTNSKLDGTYNVANISASDTLIGNNYTLQCNVTDGYLTDTDTSPVLTIVGIQNFTASARNEWSDAIINNFTINISSVGLNQDWRNTTLSVSGGKVINIFFNQYNLTYNGTTIVVGNDCIIYEGDIITFAAVGGRLFCDSSPGISRILLNPYISGENFTLTGIGDYTASTTNSENVTSLISEELANITFFSDNYFDRTYSDWNLSDNLEANLHQSEISFLTKELITNDTLTGVTYVIDGTTDTTFNLSIGEHTVTASKSGYYDLNYTFSVTALQNETLNITGMFDSILNITLSKYPSAATINNFTITTSHQTTSTTAGFVELHTLQGYLNVINITSSGYASRFNQEFTTTALLNSTDYTMYLFNSIRILIYNETSDDLIDFQNVTINTISTLTTFENTSTTGNITLGFLNPTTYELRFSSANYTTTSYFLTVNNDTTQEIKVYLMLNTSNVDLQRVKVIDGGNNAIGGSTIWLQKEDVGTFTTVNQRISGSDGLATFYVKKDIDQYYRFIVIQDGTVVLTTEKTVFVPGIDDIIELVITAADITDDTALVDFWSINTTVWITGDNEEIINYQFIDGQDTINGGRLLITMEDLLTGEIITKYNITKTGNNGLYTVALDELNDSIYNIKAYITYSDGTELVVWEGTKTFTITVIVKRNTGLLYAILILLFAAFLTSKDFNPLFSLIISFGILIPLTYLKIISVPIGVITGFITLAIIVFIKIRGGGNQ